MQKILFAIGHRELEEYISSQLMDEFMFVGTTVYREGILMAIEKNNPDIVIIRETLEGNQNMMSIIYEIRDKFPNVRIVFIAGNRQVGDELLSTLVSHGIYDILSGKQVLVGNILSSIRTPKSYSDVKHYQPIPIHDENRNKVEVKFNIKDIDEDKSEYEDIDKENNSKRDNSTLKEIDKIKTVEHKVIEDTREKKEKPKITIPIPSIELKSRKNKEIKKTKETKENNSQIKQSVKKERIISFLGGRAGVGTTSIAINCAIELAKKDNRVIYIELNNKPSLAIWYNIGHVSKGIDTSLENISEKRPDKIKESIVNPNSLDSEEHKTFPKNLDILLFSKEYITGMKSEVDISNFKELCLYLLFQMQYDYVIVDISSNIAMKDVLETIIYSSKLFTVINQDVSTINYHLKDIEELSKLGVDIRNKNSYIINNYESDTLFSEKEIVDWLDVEDIATIPYKNKEFINSNFKGFPFIISNKLAEVKKIIQKILND